MLDNILKTDACRNAKSMSYELDLNANLQCLEQKEENVTCRKEMLIKHEENDNVKIETMKHWWEITMIKIHSKHK